MYLNYFVSFILFNLVNCAPSGFDISISKNVVQSDIIDESNIIPNTDETPENDSGFAIVKTIKSVIKEPVRTRESALLEVEGKPSQILSAYDNTHKKVADTFHPLPIVDTIQEYEKYGNSGDKFYTVGRAIVNGFEGFSNLVNKLIGAPVEIAKQFSRGITDKLNNVGGKIVGLQ